MEDRIANSISSILKGSTERLATLRAILDNLVPTETEGAAKIAAAVAIAKLAHDEIVVAANLDGIIVYVNDGRLLGYDNPGELMGQPTSMLVPEAYRQAHREGFQRYVETGQRRLESWQEIPLVAMRKDGSEVNVLVSFEDITVLGHRMIVGVMRKMHETVSERMIDQVAERVIEKISPVDPKSSSGSP